MFKQIGSLVVAFLVCAGGAQADCLDLSQGDRFKMVRHDPYFAISLSVLPNGVLSEQRVQIRNGAEQLVDTIYWNTIIAVERKASGQLLQIQIPEEVRTADFETPNRRWEYPISLVVKGQQTNFGKVTIESQQEATVEIADCIYSVMPVRVDMAFEDGSLYKNLALLSLDNDLMLGSIAMIDDWTARSSVFFDEITWP